MRILERECREDINWCAVVLLVVGAICAETTRTKQWESDNIARSTFALIGRRALQLCICYKHYKIHNANAFHIWSFRSRKNASIYSHTFCFFSFHWFGSTRTAMFALSVLHSALFYSTTSNPCLLPTLFMSVFHLMSSQISSFSRWLASLFMRINKLMICHRFWHWWPSYTVHVSMHVIHCCVIASSAERRIVSIKKAQLSK